MAEYKIIGALMGLAGATNNNPKTENTDNLVIQALAASQDKKIELIDEIHAEKFRISPGCASCKTPCSNTSDYEIKRIFDAADEIKTLKLKIISELRETAGIIYKNKIALSEEEINLFYKALSYLSYDIEKEPMHALLTEVQELKLKNKKTNQ